MLENNKWIQKGRTVIFRTHLEHSKSHGNKRNVGPLSPAHWKTWVLMSTVPALLHWETLSQNKCPCPSSLLMKNIHKPEIRELKNESKTTWQILHFDPAYTTGKVQTTGAQEEHNNMSVSSGSEEARYFLKINVLIWLYKHSQHLILIWTLE